MSRLPRYLLTALAGLSLSLSACSDDAPPDPVCGDGQVDPGEACDDGNTIDGDGCSSTCTVEAPPECGDGTVDSGEECDDGNFVTGDGCSSDCVLEFCGDGATQVLLGEECDDGNIAPADGCDADCLVELCGNGATQFGEQCDDGNNTPGDGCDADCVLEVCGNGIVQVGEQCDDGNTADGDGCSSTCTNEVPPACGDGILQAGEQCDDGNTTSGDGCNDVCENEFCGDGAIQGGLGEQCDDGNNVPGDGCNDMCLSEFCGDGVTQAGLGEQCDDGNVVPGDGCDGACVLEVCGNGVVQVGEQCDDGNTTPGDGCDGMCMNEVPPACGDGILQTGEQCDDGNTTAEDGCSDTCQLEVCGDGIIQVGLGEQCDDGGTVPGDGCDDACQLELLDADMDTIRDFDDGVADPDGDGVPAYLDTDSDGDCVPDAIEAGDADLFTPPVDTDNDGTPDFLDLDSDGDYLQDGLEDANCDGVLDPGETSPTNADTDNDGASDLVEDVMGTDPQDPMENPQTNGDLAVVMPYMDAPEPNLLDLALDTALKRIDVYLLVDRSGSMADEINSIRNDIATVANNLTCPPLGAGDPMDCIADIWWGLGTIGYRGGGGQSYTNHLDVQPDPAQVSGALPTSEPTGCCDEPISLATYSAITGLGSSGDGTCSVTDAYPARASCNGSPADVAGHTGLGYPCFRDDALPLVLVTTDEAPSVTYNCPTLSAVVNAANLVSVKLMGVVGSSASMAVDADLSFLASNTGTVDGLNGNAPVVVDSTNGAAVGIEQGIRAISTGLPLDIAPTLIDDPGDMVDTIAEFVLRVETAQLGTTECTAGLMDQDTDGSGFPDTYLGVPVRTPLCWRITPMNNNTVMPMAQPQLFAATIEIRGAGITLLDQRQFYFIVPPML